MAKVEKEQVDLPQYETVVYRNADVENYQLKQLAVGDEIPKSNATFMYISAITANLLLFSCASGLGWTSPVIPLLESSDPDVNPLGRPVTPLEVSWIASLMVLGASFGPLCTARLGDSFGRKKALIFISIPHILSISILAYATDIRIYYVTRFVTGFVMGSVFGFMPVYLAEIAEMRNRNTVGPLMTIFITSGISFSFLIGPLVSVKILTLSCVAPGILFLIIFSLFIPESPVYLAAEGDFRQAAKVLVKLRRQTHEQVQKELRLIMKTIEAEKQESTGKVIELLKDTGLRKSLVICLGIFVLQQLSGINALTAFLEKIFIASDTGISNYVSTNIVIAAQVSSAILGMTIVDKFSKRSLLIVSALGTSVSLSTLAIYFNLRTNTTYNIDFISGLPIVSIVSFAILFGVGISSLPWGLASEIFPTEFRALAGSLASFVCFFSSFLVTLGFPLVLHTFGMALCFWFFSGCMLMCTLFIYYLVPETAGKTPAEIQEILKK